MSPRSGVAVAVGKFDALHLGHRALAERAAQLGEPRLLRLTGLAEAFGWAARAPLVAEDDRARVLATWAVGEAGADFAALRGLDAAGFLDWLRASHAATALVVGADFRCGRGRSAGVAELAPLCAARGMALAVVAPVAVAGAPASSSRIRAALARGDVAEAVAVEITHADGIAQAAIGGLELIAAEAVDQAERPDGSTIRGTNHVGPTIAAGGLRQLVGPQ